MSQAGGSTSPTAALPHVDVHSVVVPASRGTVWSALEEYVAQSLLLPTRHPLARVLGTAARRSTELRAVTDAAFPGPHGRVYRALVISSGGHAVATTRILRSVRRRAVAAQDGRS